MSSSPDPSWDVAEGSGSSEDDEVGNGFIAIDNVGDELNMREHIGDPGSMFTPCDICGALKLNPILDPVRSPGELTLKSLCCQMERLMLVMRVSLPQQQRKF